MDSNISDLEQVVLDLASGARSGFILNPAELFENFKKTAEFLDLVQTPYPVIIIAGTNGKGSVAHGLSYFFTKSGYNTGLFTSPHLFNFNERICINNQPVCEELLLEVLENLKKKIKNFNLNYFQISCLLALEYFKKNKIEFGIFEIGLGGKYDPVNILNPVLSFITSISKDHMEILGDNLEKIAEQKLGIARINTPLFYADKNPQEIISKNKISQHTEIYGRDFFYPEDFENLSEPKMAKENAALVLRALDYLAQRFPKLLEFNKTDILKISAPGRLVFKKLENFEILIDVAHNEDSVRRLRAVIEDWILHVPPLCPSISSSGLSLPHGERRRSCQIQAVFTAKPSKDIKKMIELLNDLVQGWYVTGLSPLDLKLDLNLCDVVFEHLNLHHCASLKDAYQGALKSMKPGGLLVCFGSFTVASFVLKELEKP